MSEATNPTSVPPHFTLFDAQSVTIATLFGTPVAGSVLMAVNDKRLGAAGKGYLLILAALVVTGIVCLAGYSLPAGATTPIAIALLIGMRYTAVKMQGPIIAAHVATGGKLGSRWVAFGLGVFFMIVLFLAIFVPAYFTSMHKKVIIGSNDEVFYTGSATSADAQALGQQLKTLGYFKDRGSSVSLDKGTAGTALSLVVKDGIWNQPGIMDEEEEVAREVAPAVGGFPLHLKLMNAQEEVKKEAVVGKYTTDKKDEIYYLGTASDHDAQALAQALTREEYLSGNGATVLLTRNDGQTILTFVVSDGYWNDPQHVSGFEDVVRAVAPSIGGLPITLRLVSTSLDTKKEVKVN